MAKGEGEQLEVIVKAKQQAVEDALKKEQQIVLDASFVDCRVSNPQLISFDRARLSVTSSSNQNCHWISGCPLPLDRDSWWTIKTRLSGAYLVDWTHWRKGWGAR